jgi:hypothetical protein
MATTGTAQGITPGSRWAGLANCVDVLENSVQTYKLGAPLVIDASGLAAAIATNGTLIYGFALKDGQNTAAGGSKYAKIFKVAPNDRFEGTLSVASWAQSLVGSKVAFGVVSSTWVLQTLTSISSIAQAVVLGVNSNWQPGDTNPIVIFSVLNANIQGGV